MANDLERSQGTQDPYAAQREELAAERRSVLARILKDYHPEKPVTTELTAGAQPVALHDDEGSLTQRVRRLEERVLALELRNPSIQTSQS